MPNQDETQEQPSDDNVVVNSGNKAQQLADDILQINEADDSIEVQDWTDGELRITEEEVDAPDALGDALEPWDTDSLPDDVQANRSIPGYGDGFPKESANDAGTTDPANGEGPNQPSERESDNGDWPDSDRLPVDEPFDPRNDTGREPTEEEFVAALQAGNVIMMSPEDHCDLYGN